MTNEMIFTKEELNEMIYCMEEMTSAYQDDYDPGIEHYSSALDKLTRHFESINSKSTDYTQHTNITSS